jgi:hypothetical protein
MLPQPSMNTLVRVSILDDRGASVLGLANGATIPVKLPKPTCQAVPTNLRRWPFNVKENQHTTIGKIPINPMVQG